MPKPLGYPNGRPPLAGVLKIKSDIRFNRDKKIANAGIIMCNENGDVVIGLTKVSSICSSLTAEAMTMKEVVNLAINCHMDKVVIESDHFQLVKACKKEVQLR